MRLFEFVCEYPAYVYFAAVSIIAIAVTAYDKIISKKSGKVRVREATLFLISALGGSLAMYAAMLFVRHKTKHKRFMIGLPLMMIFQAAAIILVNIKI